MSSISARRTVVAAARRAAKVAPPSVPRADGYAPDIFLDFANNVSWYGGSSTNSLDSILTCARATPANASYTDALGRISYFAANTLRYGTAGLLVEEARTNLCIRSEEMDNAAWGRTDTTVTANNTAAPDGNSTADLLTEGTAGSGLLVGTAASTTGSANISSSIYLKRGNTDWVRVICAGPSITNGINVWVNLATGTIGTFAARGAGTAVSARIRVAANGFFRLEIVHINSTDTSSNINVCSAAGDNSSTRVNNATYYAWGAQIENNAAFCTSYIPTTSASVTRAGDNISFTSTAGQLLSRGSWFTEIALGNGAISVDRRILTMRVTGSEQVRMGIGTGNKMEGFAGGATTGSVASTNNISAGAFKEAFAYTTNDVAARFSASLGASPADDTTADMPIGAFVTYIGSANGSTNFLNDYIKSLAHWTDRRLSTSALLELTTDVPIADGALADIFLDFANGRFRKQDRTYTTDPSTILSCTRAGTATYTNALGVVSDVSANVLRYGTAGLLVEESRTNLFARSQEFDNASWTSTFVTPTADQTAAPDGTTTADLITADGSANQHFVAQSGAVSGTQYAVSVYAKAGTAGFIHFLVTSANIYAQFNLATGALVFSSAGTGVLTSTSATLGANGFWRFTVVFTQSSGSTQSVRIYTLAASQNVAAPSETTAVTMYLWGAQLEAGASATSYIKTTSASVTRNADNISFISTTGQLLSRGTWTAEWSVSNPTSGVTQSILTMNVDGNNYNRLTTSGSGNATAHSRNAGADAALLIAANVQAANTYYKQAFAYNTDDFAQTLTPSLDGTQPNTDISGVPPSGVFTTYVGSFSANTACLNGYIKTLGHWTDRRVSNSGLSKFTAGWTPPTADGYEADIALDFTTGRSKSALGIYGLDIASILSCTRSGTATYTDASGNVSDVLANVLRMGTAGLLVEEARTNSLRNNTMVGVTPGVIGSGAVIPTNWRGVPYFGGGGLTTTLGTPSTVNGITYMDVTLSGTPSDANDWFAEFETTTGIAASNGQTWTESVYLALVGGSLSAVDLVRLHISEHTGAGALVTEGSGSDIKASLTSTLQRFTLSRTLSGGGTVACVSCGLRVDTTNAVGPINITLRIGLPQMEQGAFATSVIKTLGAAAVTRNADNISFVSTAGQLLSRGTWYSQFNVQGALGIDRRWLNMRIDVNNQILYNVTPGNLITGFSTATAGNTGGFNSASQVALNTDYKAACAYQNNDFIGKFTPSLGADPAADTTADMPSGAFTTYVGSTSGSVALNGNIKSLAHWTDRRISNGSAGLPALVA